MVGLKVKLLLNVSIETELLAWIGGRNNVALQYNCLGK